jgi:hypothetical protein
MDSVELIQDSLHVIHKELVLDLTNAFATKISQEMIVPLAQRIIKEKIAQNCSANPTQLVQEMELVILIYLVPVFQIFKENFVTNAKQVSGVNLVRTHVQTV